MMVRVVIDKNCEMLRVQKKDEGGREFSTIFEGNYWDFKVPADIASLLDKLGIGVATEEFEYQDD